MAFLESSTKHVPSLTKKPLDGSLILLLLAIPTIGVIDYLTGPDITFGVIYLIPLSVVGWLETRNRLVVITSGVTVMIWLLIDLLLGRFSFIVVAYIWNMSSRLFVIVMVTSFFSSLRRVLERANELSQRDPLTNALNVRGFRELAEHEIHRCRRSGHAITLIYLDVDNFKAVNDTFGHNIGDLLLARIVESMRESCRKSDIVGRLGGDEFAILLPETEQEAAKSAVTKIHNILLDNTTRHDWPISFSIGVLTCLEAPPSVDLMLGIADRLMYTVKVASKDGVAFSIYPADLQS